MSTFYLDWELGNDSNNGTTWALAWKTVSSGPTAARIAPGDEIRMVKSPAPTRIGSGNISWTNLSKTVTLDEAVTANICTCESIWTAGTGSDCTVSRENGDVKQGTYSAKFTLDASAQTSIMQAYFATGDLDLSAYQKISFWVCKNSKVTYDGNWNITLCSNADGTGVVDTFEIPAITNSNLTSVFTVARTGGGNLGSNIKSIAINTGSVSTNLSSSYITIDNVIACTTDGLNLQSLISKESSEYGGTHAWYPIQSISGTTVMLDWATPTSASGSASGAPYGYYGVTESVPTYKRETIKMPYASTGFVTVNAVQDSGNNDSVIKFSGGWERNTTNQNGESFIDGLGLTGIGFTTNNNSRIHLERLSACRFATGIQANGNFNIINNITCICGCFTQGLTVQCHASTFNIISIVNNAWTGGTSNGINISASNNTFESILNLNGNGRAIYSTYLSNFLFKYIKNMCYNYYSVYLTGATGCIFERIDLIDRSGGGYGFYLGSGAYDCVIKNTVISNSLSGSVYFNNKTELYNVTLNDTTEVGYSGNPSNQYLYSEKHDGTIGNNIIFADYGRISTDATTRHTDSGLSWKFELTNFTRISVYPLILKLAEVYCVGGQAATVSCYLKKSHATNITGAIQVNSVTVSGAEVTYTSSAMAENTDWQNMSITFTPDNTGVYKIYGYAWCVNNTGSVYFDDMTLPTGVITSTLDITNSFAQPWAQNAPAGGGSTATAYAFIG